MESNLNRNFIGPRGRKGSKGKGRGKGNWRGGRQMGQQFGEARNEGNRGQWFRGNWSEGSRGNRNEGFRGYRQGNQWPKKQRQEAPARRLLETDIGVTEYLSKHDGFSGIIKSRYSDFQVSEINEEGVVAKLTDLSPPKPPEEEQIQEDEELLLCKYNLEVVPMETWDRINKLALCTEPTDEVIEIDATGMSKEQRTKIHDTVKKAFGDIIVSSTVNVGDKKTVRFEKYRKGVRIDNRVKWVWPGEYVYFIVHKENCDTMEAASRIAERMHLGIKPSMLGYAGTKDRRAKTSQWFSLRKVDPRKIAAACKDLREIKVGNFEFKHVNLQLGMLQGNQFRIALRNVTASPEVVAGACEALRAAGFINYYGLQRFGTRVDTPTHKIGLHLLQGKFKEAIESILEERAGPMREGLRAYREVGPAAALRQWPRRLASHTIEARLLRALANNPTDLLGALAKLARNTRLLYLHSYQSLVWNRAVSERLRRLGHAPAPGDLVPLLHHSQIKEEIEDDENVEDEESEASTETESQNGDPDLAHGYTGLPPNSLETSIKQIREKIPVRVLTQEDVDSGRYKLSDVIMPLPGYMIDYPPNMKDYYEELLAKDGLTLEMKHRIKSYSLSGAYRYIVIKPLNVSWRCVRYSEPFCDLQLSDWDLLQGQAATGICDDGKFGALLLTMTLPPSCYATMALRELLKLDTSGRLHAQQNNYHLAPDPAAPAAPAEDDLAENDNDAEKLSESEVKEEMKEEDEEEKKEAEKRKLEAVDEVELKKLKQELEEEEEE